MRLAGLCAAILAAFALALPATAAPAPAPAPAAAKIETTKGVTKPNFPTQLTEEYRVETKHGTMYGWVTRPDPDAYPKLYSQGQGSEGAGVPVVLKLSPYNTLNQPVEELPHALGSSVQNFFAPRGYAYAQFDVVGTRESGGCYDYGGIRERETAAAVVDFLGSQDWSNGNVGMIGGSYDGTTQFAAAVEQPKHLKAIIPQVAIDRWYDYAYGEGVRYFLNSEEPTDEGFDTPFGFDFGFAIIPPSSADGESATVLAERINPCDRLEHTRRGYDPDPVYDEFWKERDYRRRASKIQVPTFIEGGWLDHNVKHWDSTQMFEALPDDLPKKLVMGQWPHSASQFDDAQNMRHAWFDKWLLGLNTGVMQLPPVDSQLNTGQRTQLGDWPPPGTRRVDIPLTAKGSPGHLGLEGDDPSYRDIDKRLTEDEALEGLCEGRCLVFVTEPLTQGVRISGQPTLRLRATSDAESTHYTPVVFEEAPDGTRSVISRGFLNTRNRNGLSQSDPLTPGEAYTAPISIWDTDYRVAKGNRLGVAVLSANAAWALPEDDSAATNTLKLAGASWLTLPLSEGAPEIQQETREGGGRTGPTGDDRDGTDGGGGGGVGNAGDGRSLPATGAGAVLPGLVMIGAAAVLVRRRR